MLAILVSVHLEFSVVLSMYSYKLSMIFFLFPRTINVRNKLCYVKYGGQLTTCMM